MADIQTYLKAIMSAVYGKDVRQSIHDSIKQCYYDGKAGAIDLEARERAAAAEARMDTFTSLPSGSTSGNSELLDIRVGLDGTKYSNAGTAVREQIRDTRTIEVTTSEPSKENTQVWINPNEIDEFTLPEAKDYEVNEEDTWSSEKIDRKIAEVFNEVFYVPAVRNYYNAALHTEETCDQHYYFEGKPYETTEFDNLFNATALFEIEPNVQYTIGLVPAYDITTLPWHNATSGIFFYDKNKVYISGTAEGTFVTPINAKYARFNYAIGSGVFLDRLNERCMLVKGSSLPDTYIPYKELVSVKQRVDELLGQGLSTIAYKVSNDSITLSSKYSNAKDVQYVLERKGGNNLFDFSKIYIYDSSDSLPVIHDISDTNLFISGVGDWHAPFKIAAVNNANGDQPQNDSYFTGGNHQYNNTGSGSTATASHVSLEFIADGITLVSGDTGYAKNIEIVWVNNIQGYNTTKADGSGREILQERHKMFFDGYEFKTYVELVPLEDITCKLWYGFQIFNDAYTHVQYLDGSYRAAKSVSIESESGDASSTIVRLFDDAGNVAEMEIDPTFDLGKRSNYTGTGSMFTASYGKTYCGIINKSTAMNEGCVYSLRGIYRFKSSLTR